MIGAGWASYSVEAGINGTWNLLDFGLAGLSGMIKGISTFGIGFTGGRFFGAYDSLILNPFIKGMSGVGKNLVYAFGKAAMGRTMIMTEFVELLFRAGVIGGIATGIRAFTDWVFGT